MFASPQAAPIRSTGSEMPRTVLPASSETKTVKISPEPPRELEAEEQKENNVSKGTLYSAYLGTRH